MLRPLISIATLVFTSTAFAQEADKIYPKAGAVQTGVIKDVTRDNVVMEIRGNTQNFPTHDIARIVYEDEPPQFSRAKEQTASGQWDQALESLKRVDEKAIARSEIQKDLKYYQAYILAQRALRGSGDPAVAKQRLMAYASGTPQSHHFYDLSEALGLIALSTGSFDDATKFFGAMGKSKFEETKLKGQYLLGTAQLATGKVEDARKSFADAIAATAETPNAKKYQKMARVSVNRCDVADGKIDVAVESLRKIVTDGDNSDSQLFANLYNALGEAHEKSGQKELAILDYLHTDLLFSSETDAHAEALFHLSQLFASSGETQRAADAKSRLQSQYATSPWAKK